MLPLPVLTMTSGGQVNEGSSSLKTLTGPVASWYIGFKPRLRSQDPRKKFMRIENSYSGCSVVRVKVNDPYLASRAGSLMVSGTSASLKVT